MNEWYPQKLNVSEAGTRSTYDFMQKAFLPNSVLRYAEFGIYRGDTAANVCKLFPNCELHLFDFDSALAAASNKLSKFPNRIFFYGNTERYNDSYNWNLMKLIEDNDGRPIFDYCFLDGAHTVAVDALNFFLADRLLSVGGYMDFDDYDWRIRGSSLDPDKVPEISLQYTDEQINSYQVKMIIDTLVKRDCRYVEVVKDKVFKKVS